MNIQNKRLGVEERKAKLLDFGREHFAKHSYDAFPMQDIAKAAGVSKGLLYHYFGGRKGFYLGTIQSVADDVIHITTLDRSLQFDVAIHKMLIRFVTYVSNNGQIYRALIRGGIGADPDAQALLDSVRKHAMQEPLTWLKIQNPSPGLHVFLVGWLSFVENATAEWVEVGGISLHEMVEILMAQVQSLVANLLKEAVFEE